MNANHNWPRFVTTVPGSLTSQRAQSGRHCDHPKDHRLIVSLFPNSDTEAATRWYCRGTHSKEGPELKKARKERLLNVTQAVIERFKFND